MVTIAIVAILASIALPLYTDYVTRSKLTEAHYGLQEFRVRMEQFFQDNRNYGSGGSCGVDIAVMVGGKYFDFSCARAGGPPDTYLATATGKAGTPLSGFTFTVRADNTRITTALPPRWGAAPVNCWVTRKGGQCT